MSGEPDPRNGGGATRATGPRRSRRGRERRNARSIENRDPALAIEVDPPGVTWSRLGWCRVHASLPLCSVIFGSRCTAAAVPFGPKERSSPALRAGGDTAYRGPVHPQTSTTPMRIVPAAEASRRHPLRRPGLSCTASAATPSVLLEALTEAPAPELRDVGIIHSTRRVRPLTLPPSSRRASGIARSSSAARPAGGGRGARRLHADLPLRHPGLFTSRALPLDVALRQRLAARRARLLLAGHLGGRRPAAVAPRAGHRPDQPRDAAHPRRQLPPRRRRSTCAVEVDRPPYERTPPRDGESRRDRRARRRAGRRRRHAADGHRRDPDAVLARPGDKHDLGVHTEMFSDGVVDLVEKGVDHRRAEEASTAGKIVTSVRDRHAAPLRLRRRQPAGRVAPRRLHQRHRLHPQYDRMVGDQLGDRGRPDRPGVRRLDRHRHLLAASAGRWTSSAARRSPRRARRSSRCPRRPRAGQCRASCRAEARAPAWSRPAATCTTSSPSTASPTVRARAARARRGADRHRAPRLPRRAGAEARRLYHV